MHLRRDLFLVLLFFIASPTHAQDEGAGLSGQARVDAWQQGLAEEAKAPAIPIFFGQSYEGRLNMDNGTKQHWRKLSYFKYEPAPIPVVYFYIDLYEKESLTYGLWTDTEVPLTIQVTYEKVDRKGAPLSLRNLPARTGCGSELQVLHPANPRDVGLRQEAAGDRSRLLR